MRWLSVDPGETTGWALWEDQELVDAGQTELVEFIDLVAAGAQVGDLAGLRFADGPFEGIQRLVIEDFRIYPWKAGDLEFDEVRTARGIGALEFIARHAGLEIVMQPATVKEPAMAAGARELFFRPLYENRHANDAIMHGWYFIATTMLGVELVLPNAKVVLIDPSALVAPEEE